MTSSVPNPSSTIDTMAKSIRERVDGSRESIDTIKDLLASIKETTRNFDIRDKIDQTEDALDHVYRLILEKDEFVQALEEQAAQLKIHEEARKSNVAFLTPASFATLYQEMASLHEARLDTLRSFIHTFCQQAFSLYESDFENYSTAKPFAISFQFEENDDLSLTGVVLHDHTHAAFSSNFYVPYEGSYRPLEEVLLHYVHEYVLKQGDTTLFTVHEMKNVVGESLQVIEKS